MNCREFAEFLNRYLDGDLTPPERDEFDRHLAECPACVAYLAGYQKTIRVLHAATPDHLEMDAVPEDLIRAILASAKT